MSYDSLNKFLLGFIFGMIWLSIIILPFLDGSNSVANIIQSIGALSTGFSAFIALIAFLWNIQKSRIKSLSDDAILNLERAYEVFTKGSTLDEPIKDRLIWLTAARHLKEYENIKKELVTSSSETQFRIVLSHEEYWRSKFYELLKGKNGCGLSEYAYHDGTLKIDSNQIAPSSLAVIYSFIEWPEGKEDPLANVDHLKIFKESKILLKNRGLEKYLTTRFKSYKNAFSEEIDT